jgi:hypothetical protein
MRARSPLHRHGEERMTIRARAAAPAAAFAALLAAVPHVPALAAVDSYRFMHVTIETPWHIFLFLLIGVFAPFILMVALVWRNAWRKIGKHDARRPGQPRTPPLTPPQTPPPQPPEHE